MAVIAIEDAFESGLIAFPEPGHKVTVRFKPEHGEMLADRDILYAPDYVINAGGIVNVSVEFHDGGYDEKVALRKIERIPQALKELWTISDSRANTWTS